MISTVVAEIGCSAAATYLRALVFLLLRLRRRTRFFLHLALIFDKLGGSRQLTTVRSVSLAPNTACDEENDREDDNGSQRRDNDNVADLVIHVDGVGRVCAETEMEMGKESSVSPTFVCRR